MKASFLRAIAWLAINDDCEWVYDKDWSPSVAACLVADLFGKTDRHVHRAIGNYRERERLDARPFGEHGMRGWR